MRVQKQREGDETLSEPNHNTSRVGAGTFASYLKLVSDLVNSVECGACNAIIYTPQGKFDEGVFRACRRIHYSESPSCKPKVPNTARMRAVSNRRG